MANHWPPRTRSPSHSQASSRVQNGMVWPAPTPACAASHQRQMGEAGKASGLRQPQPQRGAPGRQGQRAAAAQQNQAQGEGGQYGAAHGKLQRAHPVQTGFGHHPVVTPDQPGANNSAGARQKQEKDMRTDNTGG